MTEPFAYLRKSSVRDESKDTSPETQEREVRALAARHGDVIADSSMLSDWDVSGRAKYTAKRTNYLRLVTAIETGQVSAVYSYSLSRLGRSVAELSRFFDLCGASKVPVRLVVDSVDTSTASGRLLANVLGSVAQFEAEVSSERILAMYDTKRARAAEQGLDPRDAVRTSRRYGEQRTVVDRDGKPQVHGEGEDGELVLRVFRETGSYSRAARRLNEMGVKPRSSASWWASSVGVVVERLDPEIAARPKARGHRKGGTNFVLAKLLRCPMDGAMLTGASLPLPKGGRVTRYVCRHGEAVKHPRVSIAEHLILPAIEEEAARYWNPDEHDASPDRAAARTAELVARRQRIVEARLDGLVPRDDARRQVAEIDSELNRLVEPKRPDLRLPAGMSPKEINASFHALFERVDLDPVTFQPVNFVWRNPAWREPDEAVAS
jgi:DNA invertase Pin-like site-specific DNA recombinase